MDIPVSTPPHSARRFVLLAYPFRPFFLLTGTCAVVVMAMWAAALFLGYTPPLAMPWVSRGTIRRRRGGPIYK